jgi:Domain of unknown function (DUF4124)
VRLIGYLPIFFVALNAHAGVYKWVDAEGRVHYSDKKQVATKSTSIKVQPSPTMEELSQGQQRLDKLKASEKMNKLRKEEQQKKDIETQAKLEKKKKDCLKLLDEIEHSKHAPAVYIKNEASEKVYVDDTVRNQHVDEAQSIYDENCR